MDTEMGKALGDISRTKFPAIKAKHLAEREMYKEQKTASAHHKEKKISMQCYIWFHGCKLDCIHVTIAYAIR